MDAKTRGAWLFHHGAKLETVSHRADFDKICTAAKVGTLLSAISSQSEVTLPMQRVEALAKANSIGGIELPGILQQLAAHNLVDVGQDGLTVLGVTSTQVLSHTAVIFDALTPSKEENAVILLAEKTSEVPLVRGMAIELLADTLDIAKPDVRELIDCAEDIGFVDGEEIDSTTRLLFNGNLFRRDNAGKIQKVYASLSETDHLRLLEVNELLKRRGCVPREEVERLLGTPLFEKLNAVGALDINAVVNTNERVEYVTLPGSFGKFGGDAFVDDAMDLAKAFVTCITYGMTRSDPERGRIIMFEKLLNKLINGHEIGGKVKAIEEDYQILEQKGVVSVRCHGNKNYMQLRKPEVGQLALRVIKDGDASEESLPHYPGASVTRYRQPEQVRAERRGNRHSRIRNNRTSANGPRDVLVSLRSST